MASETDRFHSDEDVYGGPCPLGGAPDVYDLEDKMRAQSSPIEGVFRGLPPNLMEGLYCHCNQTPYGTLFKDEKMVEFLGRCGVDISDPEVTEWWVREEVRQQYRQAVLDGAFRATHERVTRLNLFPKKNSKGEA